MSKGAELIAAERERQVKAEGWTALHDDCHDEGELAIAAACYALPEMLRITTGSFDPLRAVVVPAMWPWAPEWWKPAPDDRVRELVKAGALIAAEIDRLLRAAPSQEGP